MVSFLKLKVHSHDSYIFPHKTNCTTGTELTLQQILKTLKTHQSNYPNLRNFDPVTRLKTKIPKRENVAYLKWREATRRTGTEERWTAPSHRCKSIPNAIQNRNTLAVQHLTSPEQTTPSLKTSIHYISVTKPHNHTISEPENLNRLPNSINSHNLT
jgi:hypothetical protein